MSFLKRFQTSLESLYPLTEKGSYVVAYSGGVDSHVLLHCCSVLELSVRAVHVHHGLQDVADDWVNHCQDICQQLNIQLDVVYVDGTQRPGQSPEESARNARYQALRENVSIGDCLLTGQHLDDQAETLLLQLFRTATSAGLAGMPASKALGEARHIRPLLSFSREDIEQYAKQNALQWVEDPSNEDISFDRNFVRKNVLPLLESRWSEVTTQLSVVARLQSNNLSVLEDMAAIDMANAIATRTDNFKPDTYAIISSLSIDRLKLLSSARVLNLLRYWIIQLAERKPTRNLLEEIEKSLIGSQQDANPVINFSDYEFRKYRGYLYLLKKKFSFNPGREVTWKPSSEECLSMPPYRLDVIDVNGEGLQKNLKGEMLTICFRKGGERFHPSGRQHSRSLKKLLQEEGVSPWERDSIPLLYFKDELIAVLGFWIAKKYAVSDDESGWEVNVSIIE